MALLTHMTQSVDNAIDISPDIEERLKPVEAALEQVAMQATNQKANNEQRSNITISDGSCEINNAKKAFLTISGRKVYLDKEAVSIGRRSDIVVNDPTVSGKHCAILKRDGLYYIVDCGSANGTFVDGNQINESCLLHNGAHIRIGSIDFGFCIGTSHCKFYIAGRFSP